MSASEKKKSENLVKRCEAVGWQVVRSGDNHYKVDTRRGIFTISSTPSDNRTVRNNLAAARRHGLDELETAAAERSEDARKLRIALDRKVNDTKMAQLIAVTGTGIAETVDPQEPRLEVIEDGTEIVAIGPALFKTPVMAQAAPLRDAEELLLADDRVLYRCGKLGSWRDDGVDPTKPCHALFESVSSLQSHIKFHAQGTEKEKTVKTTVAKTRVGDGKTVAREDTPFTKTRADLIVTVDELSSSVLSIGAQLVDVRNTLIKLVDQLGDLKPEIVEVVGEPDPEVIAKAAQFDIMQNAMHGLLKLK